MAHALELGTVPGRSRGVRVGGAGVVDPQSWSHEAGLGTEGPARREGSPKMVLRD